MRPFARLRLGLSRLRRDRRGVSAVEFALIAPILILTYFGLAELSSAMLAQRKVSHAASAIGDLVAQDTSVTQANLTDIFSAATTIMTPFPTTLLGLRLTSVTGDVNGNPKVDWSEVSGTGYSANTAGQAPATTLPTGLVAAKGDNVIQAEATYQYRPVVAYALLPSSMTFTEKFYLRPRQVTMIPCTDC